ncbi:MAG: hypothetical protein WCG34_13240, partial [Leptolinea sp.]
MKNKKDAAAHKTEKGSKKDKVTAETKKQAESTTRSKESSAKVETPSNGDSSIKKLSSKEYEKELSKLQIELVKLHEWVRFKGLKVVVLFEGRDAAGKGGTIKRITECLNPRICRVVALGTPTEKERNQWYFQRYVAQL